MFHHPDRMPSRCRHFLNTFLFIHNDGLVELIPEVFSRGQLDRDDHDAHDYNIDPKLESQLHEIEEKMTTAEAATVPKTAKLQLKVI